MAMINKIKMANENTRCKFVPKINGSFPNKSYFIKNVCGDDMTFPRGESDWGGNLGISD